jgi:hypothetical protein
MLLLLLLQRLRQTIHLQRRPLQQWPLLFLRRLRLRLLLPLRLGMRQHRRLQLLRPTLLLQKSRRSQQLLLRLLPPRMLLLLTHRHLLLPRRLLLPMLRLLRPR